MLSENPTYDCERVLHAYATTGRAAILLHALVQPSGAPDEHSLELTRARTRFLCLWYAPNLYVMMDTHPTTLSRIFISGFIGGGTKQGTQARGPWCCAMLCSLLDLSCDDAIPFLDFSSGLPSHTSARMASWVGWYGGNTRKCFSKNDVFIWFLYSLNLVTQECQWSFGECSPNHRRNSLPTPKVFGRK